MTEQRPHAPLLPLQQSFFVHRELGDISCYAFVDLMIEGLLERHVLGAALNLVVRRHDALRLAFLRTTAGVEQHVLRRAKVKLAFEDWTAHPSADQSRRLDEMRESLAHHVFELGNAEMVAATLLRVEPTRHHLLLCFDHLAIDGQSLVLLCHDLFVVYDALCAERRPPPPSDASFLAHVRQRLLDDSVGDDEAWWLDRYAQGAPQLELPAHPPALLASARSFGSKAVTLSVSLVERLRQLARDEGVTLFSVLFAAFGEVLSTWTNATDFTILTPHLGRRDESRSSLGCYTDILPIRLGGGEERSFAARARATHEEIQVALAHSSLSAVELARRLRASQAGEALSPVIFSSALLPGANQAVFERFTTTPVCVRTGAPATALDVIALERGTGDLILSWNFARDRMPEWWVTRLADQLVEVLDEATAGSGKPATPRVLVTPADIEQYRRLNDTAREYGPPVGLHVRFFERAGLRPEAVAIRDGNTSVSYGELARRALGVAARLAAIGLHAGDPVLVMSDRGADLLAMMLGILRATGAYVPIDPGLPSAYVERIVEQTRAKALLVSPRHAQQGLRFAGDIACLVVAREAQDEAQPVGSRAPGPDDPAYIIYTSGSTGRPKGAVISHRAIHNRLAWMQDSFPIGEGDRVLQKTRQSFDVSVWEFFWPLNEGATLVILGDDDVRDPHALLEAMGDVTVAHLVPSQLPGLLHEADRRVAPSESLGDLRWVICSGEVLPPDLAARWQRVFPASSMANLYGPTEAAIDVTAYRLPSPLPETCIPIGRPVANTQALVCDAQGRLCPVGFPGELCIGGVQLASGYVGDPERTAEAFVERAPVYPGAPSRLYRTGDIAWLRDDGLLEFVGRRDQQVKLRGMRVELGEIEHALRRLERCRDAVAVMVDDGPAHAQIVAFVVGEVEVESLRDAVSTELPAHMVPSRVHRVAQIPHIASGKIDRARLVAMAREMASVVAPLADTSLRTWLATLLGNELEPSMLELPISRLGLNSLALVELAQRVQEQRGVSLSLRELFARDPTLSELERQIEVLAANPVAQRETRPRPGSGPGPDSGPSATTNEPPMTGSLSRGVITRLIGARSSLLDPRDPRAMAQTLRVTFRPAHRAAPALLRFRDALQTELTRCGVTCVPWDDALRTSFDGRSVVGQDIHAVLDVPGPRTPDQLAQAQAGDRHYLAHRADAGGVISRIATLIDPFDPHAATALENPQRTQVIAIVRERPPFGGGVRATYEDRIGAGLGLLVDNLCEVVLAVGEGGFTIINMNLSETRFYDAELSSFVLWSLIPKLYAPIRPMLLSEFEVGEFEPRAQAVDALVALGLGVSKTGLLPPGERFERLFTRQWQRDVVHTLLDGRSGVSYGFLAFAEPPMHHGPAEVDSPTWQTFDPDPDHGDELRYRGARPYVRLLQGGRDRYRQIPDIWVLSTRSGADKNALDPARDLVRVGLVQGRLHAEFAAGADRDEVHPSFDTLTQLSLAVSAALHTPELIGDGMPMVHFHGYPSPQWFGDGEAFRGAVNPSLPCGVVPSALLNFSSVARMSEQARDGLSLAVTVEPDHGVNVLGQSVTGLLDRLADGVAQGQVALGGRHLRALRAEEREG